MAGIFQTLVAASLCWFLASSLWLYPHSLSYFNESIGGPLNGAEHLLGSNVDWGQDYYYLLDFADSQFAPKVIHSLSVSSTPSIRRYQNKVVNHALVPARRSDIDAFVLRVTPENLSSICETIGIAVSNNFWRSLDGMLVVVCDAAPSQVDKTVLIDDRRLDRTITYALRLYSLE